MAVYHSKPRKISLSWQHLYLWPLVYLLILCWGCEASMHFDQGCKLLSQTQYTKAVDEFGSALLLNPDYQQYPIFQQQYKKAKAGAHFAKGSEYADLRQWEKAAAEFLLALNEDASFPGAKTELAMAKERASNLHLEKANVFVREENLLMAIREFQVSLKYDPQNNQAKEALAQVQRMMEERHNKAQELFTRALELIDNKDWLAAKEKLEQCLRLNSNLIAARSSLETTNKAVRTSQEMWNEAVISLEQRRYDAAVRRLEELITCSPFYPEAKAELQRARQVREKALLIAAERIRKSRTLIKEKNWRTAKKELLNCLAVYPEHSDAETILSEAVANAQQGDELFDSAQTLLANKQLNEAKQLLDELAQLDPFHPEAPSLCEECNKSITETEKLLLKAEKEKESSNWQEAP